MEIFTTFSFDAAHRLPNVPDGHRCGRLHGHTFSVEVHVAGEVGSTTGWIVDFGIIKAICKPWIDQLDHNYLNDITGLENPTSENIAIWLWKKVESVLQNLSAIVVRETPKSVAIYRGRDCGS